MSVLSKMFAHKMPIVETVKEVTNAFVLPVLKETFVPTSMSVIVQLAVMWTLNAWTLTVVTSAFVRTVTTEPAIPVFRVVASTLIVPETRSAFHPQQSIAIANQVFSLTMSLIVSILTSVKR